ncbi:LysR family transcriptional regulator [Agilicoccus flavus]|uniref:LysR family transcriptional regulator n=1 Tax=Agilicoccus flavus TaxID=2775968 RepID=UPI001CF633E5|nr:LysR family transcriptional regulator [Agilicoccus flavus]
MSGLEGGGRDPRRVGTDPAHAGNRASGGPGHGGPGPLADDPDLAARDPGHDRPAPLDDTPDLPADPAIPTRAVGRDGTTGRAPGADVGRDRLDLLPLSLLVAISTTGSLGAAARSLGLAQPNASRLLRRLEADLHLRLVDRSPRGSTLTADGRLVADWAEPVLEAASRLLAGARSLRVDADSTLSIGASLTVGEHLAPGWLRTFRDLRPHVSVRLSVMNSADVVEALERGRLDLGFIESPGRLARLHGTVVARDELVVVVAPHHPWARRRRPLPLAELAGTPLIVREPGSGTRRTVDDLLGAFDRAQPVMELSSTGAIVASVVAGSGPAVLSSLAVEGARRAGTLVVVPVEDASFARSLRAVWRPTPRLLGPAGDFVLHARGRPLP